MNKNSLFLSHRKALVGCMFCALACGICVWGQAVRTLPDTAPVYEVEAVGGIWDFSTINNISLNGCKVVIYGDSLYSETIGGYRLDMAVGADSLSLLSLQSDCAAIFFAPNNTAGAAWDVPMHGVARYAGDYRGSVTGVRDRCLSQTGTLVTFRADTIHNVTCTTDIISLRIKSASSGTTDAVRVERSRWTAGNDPLPVAVASRVSHADADGRLAGEVSMLCSVDDNVAYKCVDKTDVSADRISGLLNNLSSSVNGDRFIVDGQLPDGMELCIDIVDATGNIYSREKFAGIPAEVSVASLYPGNYIAVMWIDGVPQVIVKNIIVKH